MTKGEKAEALFKEGYNCAQSVAGAFADELGMDISAVAKLMSAFGGGFGRSREVCGAVSGMTLAAGFLRGYSNPDAREEKMELYAFEQKLLARFKEENGSIICRELLGLPNGGSNPTPEARTKEYYTKRPCAELCKIAADILDEELSGGKKQ